LNKVLLYCRPGFEKECAAEISAKAAEREVYGFPRDPIFLRQVAQQLADHQHLTRKDQVVKRQLTHQSFDSGYVLFECYQFEDAERLVRELPFDDLIFARQMLVVAHSFSKPGRQ
jgi:23S rRNA (cytidine2498-2'-O)-methyltransferase